MGPSPVRPDAHTCLGVDARFAFGLAAGERYHFQRSCREIADVLGDRSLRRAARPGWIDLRGTGVAMARTVPAFDVLQIRLTPGHEGRYHVAVSSASGARGNGAFALPFSAVELENFRLTVDPRGGRVRGRSSPQVQRAREFGEALFAALLEDDAVRDVYVAAAPCRRAAAAAPRDGESADRRRLGGARRRSRAGEARAGARAPDRRRLRRAALASRRDTPGSPA